MWIFVLVTLWFAYGVKWNDTLHVSLGLAKGLEEIERTFEVVPLVNERLFASRFWDPQCNEDLGEITTLS
jgi:hypothetical protein